MQPKINPYEILLMEAEQTGSKSKNTTSFLTKLYNLLTFKESRDRLVKATGNFVTLLTEGKTYEVIKDMIVTFPLECAGAFVITLVVAFSPEIVSYVMRNAFPSVYKAATSVDLGILTNNYVKLGIKVSTLAAALLLAPKFFRDLAKGTTKFMGKRGKVPYSVFASKFDEIIKDAKSKVEKGKEKEKKEKENKGRGANKPQNKKGKGYFALYESEEDTADTLARGAVIVSKVLYTIAWVITVFVLGFIMFGAFINRSMKMTLKVATVLFALGLSRAL